MQTLEIKLHKSSKDPLIVKRIKVRNIRQLTVLKLKHLKHNS